jgi:hypothetical protein
VDSESRSTASDTLNAPLPGISSFRTAEDKRTVREMGRAMATAQPTEADGRLLSDDGHMPFLSDAADDAAAAAGGAGDRKGATPTSLFHDFRRGVTGLLTSVKETIAAAPALGQQSSRPQPVSDPPFQVAVPAAFPVGTPLVPEYVLDSLLPYLLSPRDTKLNHRVVAAESLITLANYFVAIGRLFVPFLSPDEQRSLYGAMFDPLLDHSQYIRAV